MHRSPKTVAALFVLGWAAWFTTLTANAADAARGAQQYKLCAGCHGFKGEGNQLVGAPAIAGLESWYVRRQLDNYRAGIRGGEADDDRSRQMATMMLAVGDERETEELVAYIGTLPEARPAATLAGDAGRGAAHYAPCAACHGAGAEGNAQLNGPALTGLDDWYQVQQLVKFKSGARGRDPRDIYGAQMAPMAAVLADEAAMRDVVAYIYSLR